MESEDQEDFGFERDGLLAAIERSDFFLEEGWSKPTRALDLGGVRWSPDYVNGSAALAIVVGNKVPSFLERRLRAAKIAGARLLCVVDWTALSSREALLLLSEVGAEVALIDDALAISPPLPLLKFLGVEEFAVDPDVRKELIRHGIEACLSASTSDLKGKTLEWLLHFMFSQVQDFRVRSCNYKTASEELDVVVQLTTIDGRRCWAHMSAPFLVVEAKNRSDKASQEVVSKLNTVISVKRGACKIGIIVSLSGFTSGASTQVLKLAASDRIFVLIDKKKLERWGFSDDYDGVLDDIVSEAVLD
ncbi:restriction endonuclease [Lysobacter sp. A3-1-A15]|uniref:restriction endonuclease n=1 Tax=Novilysobacter viscosus TaxID=3098602 RepID=UPI002EDB5E8F